MDSVLQDKSNSERVTQLSRFNLKWYEEVTILCEEKYKRGDCVIITCHIWQA